VRTYRRLLDLGSADMCRAGERVAPYVEEDLLLELEGMASGAGVDVLELLAVNARTELLEDAASPECSLIARRAWLAQTWDWHPDLASCAVAWTVLHPGGWFTTVTEAGILAKLGLNSAGLALGFNYLTCSADGGLAGVPVHVLCRLVLQRCRDAREAWALLGGARAAASSSLTVASGDALFAAEVSPGGTRFAAADADGWLVHTNHFLSPPVRGVDTMPARGPGSQARRDQLLRRVRDGVGVRAALSEHAPAVEPVCRHRDPVGTPWAERRATLLAVWIEPGVPSLRVASGNPCAWDFQSLELPSCWP
jgi:isopenicillin-N N-acyltransferase-like protein